MPVCVCRLCVCARVRACVFRKRMGSADGDARIGMGSVLCFE